MEWGRTTFYMTALLICLFFICAHVSALPPGFCLPENNTIFLGVFAPQVSPAGEEHIVLEEIEDFRKATGQNPAICLLSDEWMTDKKFPLEGVTAIRNEHMLPYIRFMMRSSDKPYQKEPLYTLGNIALGKYDGELRAWAREARSFGSPMIIEYGTEMNQWSYPWNGYWNGNAKGQDQFKEAYRHIITIMREEGASNLIWAFHVNAESQPDELWNNATAYYPGDEYCDMITISLFGARKPFETETRNFGVLYEKLREEMQSASLNKPVLIITGTDVKNTYTNPLSWINDAVSSLYSQKYPEIKGLIWWNTAWKNDNNPLHDSSMRLQDNKALRDEFKSAFAMKKIIESLSC